MIKSLFKNDSKINFSKRFLSPNPKVEKRLLNFIKITPFRVGE
ncbi:hypothetical protein SAMN04488097_3624 [Epilithonimonas lactis]|nr:hypothetical protein SAMN04488097_3624 [Epilithonimonas lactis]